MMWTLLLIVGLLIIIGLGIYAGRLLFLVNQQNKRQAAVRATRVGRIKESLLTITMAMEQQQCDLSEGVIRIVNLLDALPIAEPPQVSQQFPRIHALFVAVSGFAILEARQKLSKQERRKQDREREQIEAEHESHVLSELSSLRVYCEQL